MTNDSTATQSAKSTYEEILAYLKLLHMEDEAPIAICCKPPRGAAMIGRLFSTYEQAAEYAARQDATGRYTGIYVNLNRLKSDTPSDAVPKKIHVDAYTNLLVDFDRGDTEAGNASEEELAPIAEHAKAVCSALNAEFNSPPIEIFSGNGYGLILRLTSIAIEHQPVIQGFLKTLAARFTHPIAQIDTSVGDPGQLTRLCGTWNRKFPESEGRRHRKSHVISAPEMRYAIQLTPTTAPILGAPAAATYGIPLKAGVNFRNALAEKLKFESHEQPDGTYYNYHDIAGQGCLVAGHVHTQNLRNPRCSAFVETKDGRLYHTCFADGCRSQDGTSKTRIALQQLGLSGVLNFAGLGDDALALEYAERHSHILRFTPVWKKWSEWTGTVWKEDRQLRAWDHARVMLREITHGMKPAQVAKYTSVNTVTGIVRLAQSDSRLVTVPEQWDSDTWLLNTPGGVVDLRTGAIQPHRQEDYITRITAAVPGGKCDNWRKLLALVTQTDEELQSFIQRAAGYALTGEITEQALFFFYGPGGNGKSTLLETLSGILADYAKGASMDTFIVSQGGRHPTELAWLRGARMVTVNESSEGSRFDEGKIKNLTGGASSATSKITARGMRQDFYEYTPQFKLFFASNNKPRLGKVDEALRRRIHIIPFMVNIAKATTRDPSFADKLKAEWNGILRWMIEGCLAWQQQGLNPPDIVKSATQEYLANEDAKGRWIDERCRLGRDANGKDYFASIEELWVSWSIWAEKNKEWVGRRPELIQYLADERGLQKHRKTVGDHKPHGFVGIGLKPEEAMDEFTRMQMG